MTHEDAFWLVAIVTVLCIGCCIAAVWVEYYLSRNKPVLPKPQARAVAGEGWRRWM